MIGVPHCSPGPSCAELESQEGRAGADVSMLMLSSGGNTSSSPPPLPSTATAPTHPFLWAVVRVGLWVFLTVQFSLWCALWGTLVVQPEWGLFLTTSAAVVAGVLMSGAVAVAVLAQEVCRLHEVIAHHTAQSPSNEVLPAEPVSVVSLGVPQEAKAIPRPLRVTAMDLTGKVNRVFLVRHGVSVGNKNLSTYDHQTDHFIPLHDEGRTMALAAGRAIAQFYEEKGGVTPGGKLHLWLSSFERTRATAGWLHTQVRDLVHSIHDNALLVEQDFGLFEGMGFTRAADMFPVEYARYQRARTLGGSYWARIPLGESRADVALRCLQFFRKLHSCASKYNGTDHIIVTHGVTLRAFVMSWMQHTPDWFENEPNPQNCAVRLLERGSMGNFVDRGYIFEGFPAERG